MEYYQKISCPHCGKNNLGKAGKSTKGIQRYFCKNDGCKTHTFMLEYSNKAYQAGIKEKVIEMAINGSGIRDTSRVLGIHKDTVISTLKKKEDRLVQVNPNFNQGNDSGEWEVTLKPFCEEVEMDEQWSFVGSKSNQRWIWYAVEHSTNTILAYVFGKRKDVVFKKLKSLLEPFNIKRYYTDDWGAYERNLPASDHEIGKTNTQKIERKNLNLRTWIKRLARKTICFSKSEEMHDIVIRLLINKVEFGIDIHA